MKEAPERIWDVYGRVYHHKADCSAIEYIRADLADARLMKLVKAGRLLLGTLPAHWHGLAEIEFRDLCDEIDTTPAKETGR